MLTAFPMETYLSNVLILKLTSNFAILLRKDGKRFQFNAFIRSSACLNEIISPNQMAFVPKRNIAENVLVAQEVVKNNHTDKENGRKVLDEFKLIFGLEAKEQKSEDFCAACAKVAWGFGFAPKKKGGLGLKGIEIWNKGLGKLRSSLLWCSFTGPIWKEVVGCCLVIQRRVERSGVAGFKGCCI
ncbi:hypothetical protein SO802_012290 [Lithocarpus litseifolius]|uniref:Reverse transcriptase domain-containing protein n=1 Tax=Lithocarpus litseifolius TaxID=425828 RepID=A0AAW2D3Q1_9ROSI